MNRTTLILIILILTLIITTTPVLSLPHLETESPLLPNHICSNYISSNKTFAADQTIIYTGLVCKPTAILTLYHIGKTKELLTNATKVKGRLPKFVNYELGDKFYYECYSCKDPSTNNPPIINAPKSIQKLEGETISFVPTCSDPDDDLTFMTITGKYSGKPSQTTTAEPGSYKTTIKCSDEYGAEVKKTIAITILSRNQAPKIIDINVS